MVVLKDYSSLDMDLQILLRQINFGSQGCCEENCLGNICPECYVLENGDSSSRLSNNVNQVVRLFFPGVLVLVLLLMLLDYFSGCERARTNTLPNFLGASHMPDFWAANTPPDT